MSDEIIPVRRPFNIQIRTDLAAKIEADARRANVPLREQFERIIAWYYIDKAGKP